MPSEPIGTYFDASVYVSIFLGPDEPYVDACQAALEDAEQGNSAGVFSSLVVAESIGCPRMRVGDGSPGDRVTRLAAARDYFDSTRFTFVEDSRRVSMRAADLAMEHDLKGPDALHLALAEAAGCERFFSLDGNHLKIERIGQLVISRPYGQPQSSIDIDA
jgi:predicted nucleic acid-binding protein